MSLMLKFTQMVTTRTALYTPNVNHQGISFWSIQLENGTKDAAAPVKFVVEFVIGSTIDVTASCPVNCHPRVTETAIAIAWRVTWEGYMGDRVATPQIGVEGQCRG